MFLESYERFLTLRITLAAAAVGAAGLSGEKRRQEAVQDTLIV